MTYKEELKIKLNDREKWPNFKNPEFLQSLNDLADSSYGKKTVEGYLASLLIYHQLTEEMTRILIKCSDFMIQIRVYPQEFQEKDLSGKMFGQLIQILKQSINDDETKKFIQRAQELNKLRIRMVHKLIGKLTLEEIKRQCRKSKYQFDKIYTLFSDIHDTYSATYGDFRDNYEEEW